MNETQKKVLIAVAAVVLGMLLFPPFHLKVPQGDFSRGYHWLFAPPFQSTVDTGTLITQWFGVLIIGGIVLIVLKNK